MGEDSPLVADFRKVTYSASFYVSGMDTSGYRPAGVKKVIALLEAAKSELALRDELEAVVVADGSTGGEASTEKGRMFIVHGHDDTRKHELARALQALTGAQPIILHEQPNGGRSIMEKLEAYAGSAGFAVALFTADDLGRAKDARVDSPRARQNVVLEAGYFAGLLGRSHVVVLHESGVEIPSDLAGIAYVPLDNAGAWKLKVAHEIANAGFMVDWAAIAGQ